jgi:hydroxypyruvate isomerase
MSFPAPCATAPPGVLQLCRHVNAPAIRQFYDIYSMQIMEGDVICTIKTQHPFFAH